MAAKKATPRKEASPFGEFVQIKKYRDATKIGHHGEIRNIMK